jgi:hypothetical protein
MLRLRRCFEELGIQQMELVRATGRSKSQISTVFKTGQLPVDEKGFREDVARYAEAEPRIAEWLADRDLSVAALFVNDAVSPVINEHGEIAKCRPDWACNDYGLPYHSYQRCPNCCRRWESWLQRRHGAAAVLGGAA